MKGNSANNIKMKLSLVDLKKQVMFRRLTRPFVPNLEILVYNRRENE